MKRLFLIDGSALAYRSYFAFISNPLINSRGENTSAVFGFTNSLLKLRRSERFDYWVIVFDTKAPTFRHELFDQYKATREKMPDDMRDQLPRIAEAIKVMNIPRLEVDGYEADDVIGTLAKTCGEQGLEVVIYSSDKDFMQLVTDRVTMLNPRKEGAEAVVDIPGVEEKFGVPPAKVIEVLGLMGDTSDNIPGVPGVGGKTALKLVKEYGSIDGLLENLDGMKKSKMKEKIQANIDQLLLSRKLVTIDCAVPLDAGLEDFAVREPDREKAVAFFKEMEFSGLVKEFAGTAEAAAAAEETDYTCIADEKEMHALFDRIRKTGACVLDVETTGIDPLKAELVGISFAVKSHEAFYIPVGHRADAQRNLDRETVVTALKKLLEDPALNVSGQNIKYDRHVLANCGVEIASVDFDTMIASYLVNPGRRQHNLDALAMEYLNYRMVSYDELVKEEGKRGKRAIEDVPLDEVVRYACEDSDLTFRLKELLEKKLEEMDLVSLFRDVEMPLAEVLGTMERTGVAIDTPFLEKMSVRIDAEIGRLTEAVYAEAGEEFNINSTQQLGKILFEKKGYAKKKKTKTGYSTNVEVLEALAVKHELPRLVLEYRMLAKLKSTYVDALVSLINEKTGRVHTSFNQTVTSTGRLSSSDPNLQNIPVRTELGREVRRAFVPGGSGAVILAADYSQIELRIMAHLAEDEALRQAFIDGEDIHTRTASLVFNTFPDMITPELRRRAKAINFGIMYGMGAYGLSRDLGISVPEATGFIEGYFRQYPGVRLFVDATVEQARKDGYVTTMLGRRRYLPEITSTNRRLSDFAERTAVNTPIQGTAADMIKLAMIGIARELRERALGTAMLMQVHDELVFEVPEPELDEVSEMVRTRMEGALPLAVPVVVDMNAGPSWFEAH